MKKQRSTLAERQQVGKRFKDYRTQAMLTQSQLAELLDMDRCTISDIERAQQMPYHSTMRKFIALESRTAAAERDKNLK